MSISSKLKKASKAWEKIKDDDDGGDFDKRPDGKYKTKITEAKVMEVEKSGNVLLILEGKATEGEEKGKRVSGVFKLVGKKGDMNEWGIKLGRRALISLGAGKIEGLEDFEPACKKVKKASPLARIKLSTKEGSDFQNFSVDKLLGDDDEDGSASASSGSGSEESGSGSGSSEESSASESESASSGSGSEESSS